MFNNTLVILLITFFGLLGLSILTYLIIFLIHRYYFSRLLWSVKKYNSIKGQLYSINFIKLELLASNKMMNQNKFEALKNNYNILKDNLSSIYTNIKVYTRTISKMYIRSSKTICKRIANDLNKTKSQINDFIIEYKNNTMYPDQIEDALSEIISLFNNIKTFYNFNIENKSKFTKINSLIQTIQEIIDKNIDFTSRFNFDSTINIFSDLHYKINILIDAISNVNKLQLVNHYLYQTMADNESLLKKTETSLINKDIEYISKTKLLYANSYEAFKNAYLNQKFNDAYISAKVAIKIMANISAFCSLHANAKILIQDSLSLINNQTCNLIENKDKIFDSMKSLSKYFEKDENIHKGIEQISQNVNCISGLVEEANSISYNSISEKTEALNELQKISNKIVVYKDQLSSYVNNINYVLKNCIGLLGKLNSLYSYNYQMIHTIESLLGNSTNNESFTNIINLNIRDINACVDEIIGPQQPDFKKISETITNISEQTEIIKQKVNFTLTLKSYATYLMLYTNRFKTDSNANDFSKAELLYKTNKYTDCINNLISICKANK